MTEQGPTPRQEDLFREIEDEEAPTVAILHAERPVPSPTFRGNLRRLLTAEGAKTTFTIRASVQAQILGCLGAGTALLLVAAAGIVGAGPFAT